jgi:hypothetical protein
VQLLQIVPLHKVTPKKTLREVYPLSHVYRAPTLYTIIHQRKVNPSPMAHWHCTNCQDSITYSCGPNGVEHRELCQCGFAMNSSWVDTACSSCALGIEFGVGQLSAVSGSKPSRDPFNAELGFPTSLDELGTPSFIACYPESTRAIPEIGAADDLPFIVDESLLRFDQYWRQTDPSATFDYNDTGDHSVSITLNSVKEKGIDPPIQGEAYSQYNLLEPHSEEPLEDNRSELRSLEGFVPERHDPLLPLTVSEMHKLQESDSGYGTLRDSSSITENSAAKRGLEDVEPESTLSRVTITTSSKRLRYTDSDGPRLACPFYKNNPIRCKRAACGGRGYVSIHRLKDHLKQAHLISRCDRCKVVFKGKKGAEALKSHRQLLEACAL